MRNLKVHARPMAQNVKLFLRERPRLDMLFKRGEKNRLKQNSALTPFQPKFQLHYLPQFYRVANDFPAQPSGCNGHSRQTDALEDKKYPML
jgi:hypothetical protein